MEPNEKGVARKINIWLIVSIILAIALLGVLVTNYRSSAKMEVIEPETASTQLLEFINEVYGPQVGQTTFKEIIEESGMYKVQLTVTDQGQPLDQTVYMSRDGKFFIPQVIEIQDALDKFREFQQQQMQPPTDQSNTNSEAESESESEPEPESESQTE